MRHATAALWYTKNFFNNSLQTDGFINNRLRGIEKMYMWSVFILLPIIHNKKNINIINKEIKGFPI